MSKSSQKRRRKSRLLKVPWSFRKGETTIQAFHRQATLTATQDQRSLVSRGWAPIEAAIEAWETMKA